MSDGHGHWRKADGTALPQFDGCVDYRPRRHALHEYAADPRLGLTRQSGTARLDMLYVPFDSFEPTVDGQHYTCLDDGKLYRYEAAGRQLHGGPASGRDGSSSTTLPYPETITGDHLMISRLSTI